MRVVEEWKIRHAIFNVLFCSVFSSNVLLRPTLYCALQKLHGFLSRSVLSTCLTVAGIKTKLLYTDSLVPYTWVWQWRRLSYSKKNSGLHFKLFSSACNYAEKIYTAVLWLDCKKIRLGDLYRRLGSTQGYAILRPEHGTTYTGWPKKVALFHTLYLRNRSR